MDPDYGSWLWILIMDPDYGFRLWIQIMDPDYGSWFGILFMDPDNGSFMDPDYGSWFGILIMDPDYASTYFSGVVSYDKKCYCPGDPDMNFNLLNLTSILRSKIALQIYKAPGNRCHL